MKLLSVTAMVATVALTACSGGGGSSSVPAPAPPALPSVTHGSLVTLDNTGTINVYTPGATTPSQTITVGAAVRSFCVDRTGQIDVIRYVGIGTPTLSYTIDTYAANANGAATPIASISNAASPNSLALDCAVDSLGNKYVASSVGSSVNTFLNVFTPAQLGSVTPAGSVPTTLPVTRVDIDGSDTVYAAVGFDHIETYARWSASSPSPRLNSINYAYDASLAVDAVGHLYIATSSTPAVTELAVTGSAYTVLRAISGSLTTIDPPGPPDGIVLGRADNFGNVYVANLSTNTIRIFNSAANGNVAPVQSITLGGTTLNIRIAP